MLSDETHNSMFIDFIFLESTNSQPFKLFCLIIWMRFLENNIVQAGTLDSKESVEIIVLVTHATNAEEDIED